MNLLLAVMAGGAAGFETFHFRLFNEQQDQNFIHTELVLRSYFWGNGYIKYPIPICLNFTKTNITVDE